MDTIWIMINCSAIYDRLRDYVDAGDFGEAMKLHQAFNAFMEKMKSTMSMRGGHLVLALYDRIIMMVPSSLAEEFPLMLQGYQELFQGRVATGFGLDLKEAAQAAKKSEETGKIEFFGEDMDKSEPSGVVTYNTSVGAPLFDPLFPVREDVPTPEGQPNGARPSLDQEIAAEAKLLAGIMKLIGGDQVQQQMQEIQQQQQQMQQQAQQPRNLLESLHGEQMPGSEPATSQESTKPQPKEEKAEPKDASPDTNDKLGNILSQIKQVLPQLTGLADKNPEAYAQAMKIIGKVLHLAKARKEEIIPLEKVAQGFAHFHMRHTKYPVGTVIGRKKKVMIDGKARWRSVSAGQVMDEKGQPISVKSSNYEATQKPTDNK